jgi:hypothetical protein
LTLAYNELRRRTGERDRSLREKVMSLEAAAALVTDGASVGIGGSTLSRTPMAMIWALIRAGRKDLVCCRSITSSEGELLFASGASPTESSTHCAPTCACARGRNPTTEDRAVRASVAGIGGCLSVPWQ